MWTEEDAKQLKLLQAKKRLFDEDVQKHAEILEQATMQIRLGKPFTMDVEYQQVAGHQTMRTIKVSQYV